MRRFLGQLFFIGLLLAVVLGMAMLRVFNALPNMDRIRMKEIHISDSGIVLLRNIDDEKDDAIDSSDLKKNSSAVSPGDDNQNRERSSQNDADAKKTSEKLKDKGKDSKDSTKTNKDSSTPTSASPIPAEPEFTQSGSPPDWANPDMTSAAALEGRFIIVTDQSSVRDVNEEIVNLALVETNRRVRQQFGESVASRLSISRAYIEKSIIKRTHFEQIEPLENGEDESIVDKGEETVVGYAELDLGKGFENDFQNYWREVIRQSRMYQLAFWGAGLLGLLGIAFGFFHADRVTRGMYTLRLQFGSFVGVAMLVVVLLWVSQTFDWL